MQLQVQKGGVILFNGVVIEQRSGQPLSMRTNMYLGTGFWLAKCLWYENIYSATGKSTAQGRDYDTKNTVV